MVWNLEVARVSVNPDEWSGILGATDPYFGSSSRIPLSEFVDSAALLAQELPRRVREQFYRFRTSQKSHVLCIAGPPPPAAEIGATPAKHRPAGLEEAISRYDAVDFMFASLLGEPFAWTTIQNGYVFNDVIPVAEHAELPASSGYVNVFGLHTEDAFHEAAGDYLGLMCLRNPDATTTPLSGIVPSDIPDNLYGALFEARFVVGANVAHDVDTVTGHSRILFGNPQFPYLRVNLNSTASQPGDAVAHEALDALRKALAQNATAVAFAPGEFWYFDNLRVAHGRDSYEPRFDGHDRWLRRLYITSAFRYSTSLRTAPADRSFDPARQLNNVRVNVIETVSI